MRPLAPTPSPVLRRSSSLALLLGAVVVALVAPVRAEEAPAGEKELPRFELVEKPAFPLPAHLEQGDIVAGKLSNEALFQAGGDLFHTPLNGLDGVGIRRTVGGKPVDRFSAGPVGGGQPIAVMAQSCGSCHAFPVDAGAGLAHTATTFDAGGDGEPPFVRRATISLHGNGLLQLLAEEMTDELLAAREAAAAAARAEPGVAARRDLVAKGVAFGSIGATADAAGEIAWDLSAVEGVSPDLVVRAFGWKGFVISLRNFQVSAALNGGGLQAEEFVWRLPPEAQPDPDADGVERELSVGDVTALTIYGAGQETPSSVTRLADLGMAQSPTAEELASLERGSGVFAKIGCASCHVPEMRLSTTVYEEPTRRGGGQFVDRFLVAHSSDYDLDRPVRFDLATEAEPPLVETTPDGGAVVRLYGDLRRHRMGRHLADATGPGAVFDSTLSPLMVDGKPALVAADSFLTAELWGVGNTGPYLHDDRAGTLDEAIRLHGEDDPPAVGEEGRGEAQESRDAYAALAEAERLDLIAFLKSLVTHSPRG